MAQSHARVLQIAQAVRAAIATVITEFDELFGAIERQIETDPPSVSGAPGGHAEPMIDRATYSVVWRGRACPLRNGLPFRLMQALAARRRQYLSIDELLETVWEEQRSRTAVRSVVWELRKRLRAGGMEDLADMIDGSCRGHYCLMVPPVR